MKKVAGKIISLSIFILILSTASCNTDSDLITDYVLLDNMNTEKSGTYASNDSQTNQDDVKVIETSKPTNTQ